MNQPTKSSAETLRCVSKEVYAGGPVLLSESDLPEAHSESEEEAYDSEDDDGTEEEGPDCPVPHIFRSREHYYSTLEKLAEKCWKAKRDMIGKTSPSLRDHHESCFETFVDFLMMGLEAGLDSPLSYVTPDLVDAFAMVGPLEFQPHGNGMVTSPQLLNRFWDCVKEYGGPERAKALQHALNRNENIPLRTYTLFALIWRCAEESGGATPRFNGNDAANPRVLSIQHLKLETEADPVGVAYEDEEGCRLPPEYTSDEGVVYDNEPQTICDQYVSPWTVTYHGKSWARSADVYEAVVKGGYPLFTHPSGNPKSLSAMRALIFEGLKVDSAERECFTWSFKKAKGRIRILNTLKKKQTSGGFISEVAIRALFEYLEGVKAGTRQRIPRKRARPPPAKNAPSPAPPQKRARRGNIVNFLFGENDNVGAVPPATQKGRVPVVEWSDSQLKTLTSLNTFRIQRAGKPPAINIQKLVEADPTGKATAISVYVRLCDLDIIDGVDKDGFFALNVFRNP